MKHLVAMSGGKDSTAMSLRLEEIGEHDYTYVFTPTGNELPGVDEHIARMEDLLKQEVHRVTPGYGLFGLIDKMKAIPNWRMRFCTRMLKIVPFQHYVMQNLPLTSYVGLRADEEGRIGLEWDNEPRYTSEYPLRRWNWGLSEVMDYLKRRGIEVPPRTDCALCFFQSLYEWYLLWVNYPVLYEEGVQLEERIGHTFRSENKNRNWPHTLSGLRAEFASGRVPTERKRRMKCRICSK